MKTLGIIGGLGPAATALFMQMIIDMTDAKTDQEHIRMVIDCYPQIPDRTGYILDHSKESPAPLMIKIGNSLADMGADLIAIPCITSNYFYEEFSREISIPVINIIEELKKILTDAGVKNVGLMATSGTIASGLFQKAFNAGGGRLILPEGELQADVMHLIYDNVKAGKPADMDRFNKVARSLRDAGAQVIILGCTELSVIKRSSILGRGYLDALEVLSKCAVERCGRLKAEYQDLL